MNRFTFWRVGVLFGAPKIRRFAFLTVLVVGLVVLGGVSLTGHTTRAVHADGANAAAQTTASRVYGQADFTSSSTTTPPTANTLGLPFRAALDNNNNLYVTDNSNNRILFYPSGQVTATQAYGTPDLNSQGEGGVGPTVLHYPRGVAVKDDKIYISDSDENRILVFSAGVMTATQVYGQGDFYSTVANHNKLGPDSLVYQAGLKLDSDGGLYVADNGNNRVLYFPPGSTTATRVYGQPDLITDLPDNGGVSGTSLDRPSDMAFDSTGGLFIVDNANNRVLYYPAGSTTATRVYGQPDLTSHTPNNGGIGPASLNNPRSVAVDKNDNVYISDTFNNRVLFYPAGSVTATVVYGQPDFVSSLPNNGTINAESLANPTGVVVDNAGGLYICDTENNRVLYFPPADASATSTQVSSSANPTGLAGQPITFTATVKSLTTNDSNIPQGQLEFLDGVNSLGQVALDANGVGNLSLDTLPPGDHLITAHYLGGNGFAGSFSASFTQTVANNQLNLILPSLPDNYLYQNQQVPITATLDLRGNQAAASGTVSFYSYYIGPPQLIATSNVYSSPNGYYATASVPLAPNFPLWIRAVFTSGTSSYNSSVSASQLLWLPRQSLRFLTLATSYSPSYYGENVFFQFNTDCCSYGGFGGDSALTIKDGSTVLATLSSIESGNFITNTLKPGTHYLRAESNGDVSYYGIVSPVVTQVVNPIYTSLALTSSLTTAGVGQSVTLTATLSHTPSSPDLIPSGVVSFTEGSGVLLGTAPLSADGRTAVLNVSYPTISTHQITATYPGDSNFYPATSPTITLNITSGPPAQLTVLGGDGQTTFINNTFPAPLVIQVKDSSSNPVSSTVVTFTAPDSGPSGTFADGSKSYVATTHADGTLTSPLFTAGSLPGSYVVTASVSGVITPASFALTNTIGGPAVITPISGTPQSATVSTTFAAPLVARVTDGGANPLGGLVVTFTAPSVGSSGTFAGSSPVYTGTTDNSGLVTTTLFTANGLTGTYAVTATVGGVVQPAYFTLTNVLSCNSLLVTSNLDDGSCGTLRTALQAASTSPTKTVTINLAAGSVITLTSGLTLPNEVVVTTTAACGAGPNNTMLPPITLKGTGSNSGNGLTLAANNRLYGLWVRGFSGVQIKAPAGSHSLLQCVRASKN